MGRNGTKGIRRNREGKGKKGIRRNREEGKGIRE